MINFDKINAAALMHAEGLLSNLFPNGRIDGHEFKVGSLEGEAGDSLQFNLRTGLWADFAGGSSGHNLTQLWAAAKGIRNGEAAAEIDALINAGGIDESKVARAAGKSKSSPSDWVAQPFADAEISAPTEKRVNRDGEWVSLPIARSWAYRTVDGKLAGFVCRVNYQDGHKDCFPYAYCKNIKTGVFAWRWKGLARPTPLYNLPKLISMQACKDCAIVEGEKKADAVQAIWSHLPILGIPGGAENAIRHPEYIDLSVFAGKRVLLFPDADSQSRDGVLLPPHEQPGIAAMLSIERALQGIAESTFVVMPPDDWKDGYDLADAIEDGWTLERIKRHIVDRRRGNARVGVPVETDLRAMAEASECPLEDVRDETQEYIPTEFEERPQPIVEAPSSGRFEWPFECFGMRGTTAYFRVRSLSVMSYELGKIKRGDLESLAPFHFWFTYFPSTMTEGAVSWDTAMSSLRDWAFSCGSYDIKRVRGMGFWHDGADSVMNVGSGLVVNGSPMAFIDYKTKYIYETVDSLSQDDMVYDPSIPPLQAKSEIDAPGSGKIIDLCKSLPWNDPLSAYFFAGWLSLAPICGILPWRPHVWLTGPAGCGKSTVLVDIIKPLMGAGLFVGVQSNTTLPAISEMCANNAVPVIYDEAESKNQVGRDRMERIIEQMRSSSTESADPIAKGVPGGGGFRMMKPRQMYFNASTASCASQSADLRRITKLELYKRDMAGNEKHYRGEGGTLDLIRITTADPNFCRAFRNRVYLLSRVTLENIKIFRSVVAKHLHDQAEGDQKGTLLAGAWSLRSSRIATVEEVTKWVESIKWDGYSSVESDKDEYACLNLLLATPFRVDDSDGRPHSSSVGEMLNKMLDGFAPSPSDTGVCALGRAGVRIADDRQSFYVASASTHPFLRAAFRSTPFDEQWHDQFLRIPGASKRSQIRIGPTVGRAVQIPVDVLTRGQPSEVSEPDLEF